LTTFVVAVPLHGQLALNYSKTTIRRLVMINWVRTFAWSLRMIVVAAAILGIST
jgi:hypothetical protein